MAGWWPETRGNLRSGTFWGKIEVVLRHWKIRQTNKGLQQEEWSCEVASPIRPLPSPAALGWPDMLCFLPPNHLPSCLGSTETRSNKHSFATSHECGIKNILVLPWWLSTAFPIPNDTFRTYHSAWAQSRCSVHHWWIDSNLEKFWGKEWRKRGISLLHFLSELYPSQQRASDEKVLAISYQCLSVGSQALWLIRPQ